MRPIALCRPDRSRLGSSRQTVSSPGVPLALKGGISRRKTVVGSRGLYGFRDLTQPRSKCRQPLIFLQALDGPSMTLRTCGESWHRVSSWQWSGLSCDIRTMSGSGRSRSDSMHDGEACSCTLNFWERMVAGPESHGSMRMV